MRTEGALLIKLPSRLPPVRAAAKIDLVQYIEKMVWEGGTGK